MKLNVGKTDKTIRILLGLAFGIAAIFMQSVLTIVIAAILAAVMFITAFSGFCPLFNLFGISSKKQQTV